MFTAQPRADALESLELNDTAAGSRLVLAPARGGLATRLRLRGVELFYLDEGTLRDPSKNVRGGNPVLFPSPGKLDGDAWARGGRRGVLRQHGFARSLPWHVAGTGTDGAASATLRLASSEETRAAYPWDFTADHTYVLRGAVLRIEQRFTNTGTAPMPFGAGFHPYFRVAQAEKAAARVLTRATRAFDNVSKQRGPLAGIDLAAAEVDLHLEDHGAGPCGLALPSGRTIELRGSPEYAQWVVWTLKDKDFVCLEPWTCPGNALNTGERLLTLEPGQSRALWVELELR